MWSILCNNILKFCDWFKTRNTFGFVSIFFLLTFLARILTLIVLLIFPVPTDERMNLCETTIQNEGIFYAIVQFCIIVPILETFVFQYLPVIFINKFSKNKLLQISVSSILFGLSHPGIACFIFATFTGIVLVTGFMLCKEQKSTTIAFWITALVHGFVNLFSIICVSFFN